MVSTFGKKLIAVRSDLIEEIVRIANRKRRTVYSFVNEILKQTIEAEEMGQLPEDNARLRDLLAEERKTGEILLPRELLQTLIQRASMEDNDSLVDVFYNTGEWLGKYCQARFSGEDPISVIENIVQSLFGESSTFDVTKTSEEIIVHCNGIQIPRSQTPLVSTFLEGLMHTLTYSTAKRDVSEESIALHFR